MKLCIPIPASIALTLALGARVVSEHISRKVHLLGFFFPAIALFVWRWWVEPDELGRLS